MNFGPRAIAALIFAVLAVLIAVGVVFMYSRQNGGPPVESPTNPTKDPAQSQSREIEDLKARLEQAESDKSTLQADLTQAKAKAEDLQKKAETLEASAAAKPVDAAPAEATPSADSTKDKDEDYETFAQRIRDNAMAKTQIKALAQLAYGDFFAQQGLDPETVRQAQEFIEASLLERTALGQYAMKQGDMTARQVKAWTDKEDAALKSELSQLMTPEQVKTWEEQNGNYQERMFESSFDSQLNSFARGLSPEAHDLALRATVDQFVGETNAFDNSDQPYTLEAQFDLQRRAMINARDQLRPTLTPEEYNLVDGWLRLGENQLDAIQTSRNNEKQSPARLPSLMPVGAF